MLKYCPPTMPLTFLDVHAARSRARIARGTIATSNAGVLEHHNVVGAQARSADLLAARVGVERDRALRCDFGAGNEILQRLPVVSVGHVIFRQDRAVERGLM